MNFWGNIIFLLFIGFSILASPEASAQKSGAVSTDEVVIAKKFREMRLDQVDSTRFLRNDTIIALLQKLLTSPDHVNEPFDSLKSLVKLESEDGAVKFFLWNIQTNKGKHAFYGFLRIKGQHGYRLYTLADKSDSIAGADTLTLTAKRWWGSLYYKVINCKDPKGLPYYTLIGWSGENSLISMKVIETLWFDDLGQPVFGLPVFENYDIKNARRVIYRFSASSTLSLKYEPQPLMTKRKWNAGKRDFDEKVQMEQMIVVDRLVPLDPMLSGQYQFYVPEDITDGFIFSGGKWKYIRDVKARNQPD